MLQVRDEPEDIMSLTTDRGSMLVGLSKYTSVIQRGELDVSERWRGEGD